MSPNDLNAPQGQAAQVTQDLGPLAWVLDELRKSMEAAVKATRRFVREAQEAQASDLGALDSSPLRIAKQQLHQSSGALEMVGMPQAAQVLRAMETALQHFVQTPQDCTEAAVLTLEKASFALSEYLDTVLAGHAISAVALFPQYRDVQALFGGHNKVHPADLWPVERRLREPELAATVAPLAYGPAARQILDAAVLQMVKGQDVPAASARMRECCLGFAQAQDEAPLRTFWKVAAGYFDAMAHGLIAQDNYTKRVASRVLMVSAALAKGDPVAPERLLQDLLFFCAQAHQSGAPELAQAQVLQAVGQAFGLERHIVVDYERPRFGRFDPAVLAQARKRIGAATEIWSALAGGDAQKIKPAVDQFSLVCESLTRLHAGSQPLAQALMRVMQQLSTHARPPSTEVGMEVATAVLYLQAAFAALDLTDETMTAHAHTLAQRLDHVMTGGAAQPLQPWMEQLYRQVSDQQTMGSVVGELRGTLAETERLLDQFFRNPQDTSVLTPVSAHLSQMRGVLSVLGLDPAVQAMVRMRQNVDLLHAGQVPVEQQQVLFEKMGNSLGALGFLIDMLSYQRNMARKLYEFDEQEGELKLLMGRVRTRMSDPEGAPAAQTAQARVHQIDQPVVLEQPAAAPTPQAPSTPAPLQASSVAENAAPEAILSGDTTAAPVQSLPTVSQLLPEGLQADGLIARDLPAAPAQTAEPSAPPPVLQVLEEDTDEELLGIFLEEAREVVVQGRTALTTLAQEAANLSEQTVLRRAFHTLKGSSRMVGLDEFGHAGWAMEQMLNAWLAEQQAMPAPMQQLSLQALQAFEAWTHAVEGGTAGAWQSAPFRVSADAMRLRGEYVPLDVQAVRGSDVAAPVGSLQSAHTEAAQALTLDGALEQLLSPPAAVQPIDTLAHELDRMLGADGAQFTVSDTDAGSLMSAADFADSQQVTEVSMEEFDALVQANAPAASDEPMHKDALAPQFLEEGASAEQADTKGALDVAAEVPFGDVADQAGITSDVLAEDVPVAPAAVPQDVPVLDSVIDSELGVDVQPPLAMPDFAPPLMPLAPQLPRVHPVEDHVESTYLLTQPEAEWQTSVPAVKRIGSVTVSVPLLNVYLNEAEEWSSLLLQELEAWQNQLHEPQPAQAMAWAHSLAGSSATVGFHDLSALARKLEHALEHVQPLRAGDASQVQALVQAAQEVRRLLHQFAAGFLQTPQPDVLQRLQDVLDAPVDAEPVAPAPSPVLAQQPADFVTFGDEVEPDTIIDMAMAKALALEDELDDDIDVFDVIDPDLFPIFEEEALELLPALGNALRDWALQPTQLDARNQVLRLLHTLKGSARLAGAMRLGEMAHRMESVLEAIDTDTATSELIDPLFVRFDSMEASLGLLRAVGAHDSALLPEPAAVAADTRSAASESQALAAPVAQPVQPALEDAAAFTAPPALVQPVAVRSASTHTVRVRSHLLDRLINEAGEVMIARSRLDGHLSGIKHSLHDLTNNLERLRQQLRDIEVQAESQMQSRMQLSKEAGADFDPLEFDRFTRVQELTRMMAESVNDVATVQRNLMRDVAGAEDDLVAQGRQARELQRDLLRTRMVEFDSVSERLYTVVRRTAKETGKQVKLGLAGGTIEMDRGVLERMLPAFEHLLRNCVDHGIEAPSERVAVGKSASGTINVQVQQEGNDVAITFSDDGVGLNVARIRDKALQRGLVQADEVVDAERAAQLVFMPGFSTAEHLTEVSGRGIGMDVVREEVLALGGRIETTSQEGQGAAFRLVLPLTTAVTQVVMLRAGAFSVGVPASLVEVVRRVSVPDLEVAYQTGQLADGAGVAVPFYWAGAVWSQSPRSVDAGVGKTRPVVVFRSASQRIALHVDEVLGHQEVVIKHLGPQMSRLPGLTGMSVLPSGAVVLIYNPVALAAVYGEHIAQLGQGLPALLDEQTAKQLQASNSPALADGVTMGGSQVPLVMVVDDSITVRRVSQRLLQREGYRVVTAADGLQALEKLQEELPCVVLSDIEMPGMDGFDLLRNIRAQAALQQLPIIMITSRIAQKHRDHAMELGANHYLGKPYSDDELMALVHHYAVGKPLPDVMPATVPAAL